MTPKPDSADQATSVELQKPPSPEPPMRTDAEPDPFALFTEWASDADEAAYRNL